MSGSPMEYAAALLLLAGSFWMFIAALGLVRMPDLYMRMSATTKAATLGVLFLMLAVMFFFREWGVCARAIATTAFVFLTNPVAGHMIGRAGYITRAPMWEKSVCDDLRGHLDMKNRTLASALPLQPEGQPFVPQHGPADREPGQS